MRVGGPAKPSPGLAQGCKAWFEHHFHRLDLVHDLAEDIGSAHWLRSFGTFSALAVTALAFWPDFSANEAIAAVPVDRAAHDEFRSQTILPLAFGGESGRRMGATSRVVPIANAPERTRIDMTATLAPGDSFGRMLQRAGVGAGDAAQAAAMIAAEVPLGEVAPGTRFALTLGKREAPGAPRPLEALKFRAKFDLGLALERRGGGLALSANRLPVDTTPLRIRGTVGSSLYQSARAAGAPVKAVQQYLQTLDGHLSLEGDITPADTFDIIVGYKRAASGESETGSLMFAGLERAGKPVTQLLRWSNGGGSGDQFYEASSMGQAGSSRTFAPVNGRLTSHFGMRRHPILGYARMHAGVDFGAGYGSPIFAVSSGAVSYAGRHGGHGNYVRLEHGGGLGSGYGHMSRIAVSPGSSVLAGQVIGYVGSSGLSTGPHLHFEVYQGGRTINPLSASFSVKTPVDAKQLAAFKARLAEIKAIKPGAALKSLGPRLALAERTGAN